MLVRSLRSILFVLWICFAWVHAGAQTMPIQTIDSIDIQALKSKTIAVGRLVDYTNGSNAEEPRISIAVRETIKGKPEKAIEGKLRPYLADVTNWNLRSPRLLVFVDPNDPWVTAIDLDASNLAVPTADLTLLKTPEAVVKYVRRLVRRFPGVRDVGRYTLYPLPNDARGIGALVVPVDQRLERRALTEIAAKDPQRRLKGIDALSRFRSVANISRLKALLRDPGYEITGEAERNRGVERRQYRVRQAAYLVLSQQWHVPVKEPIAEVSISRLATLESLIVEVAKGADLRWLAGAKRLKSLDVIPVGELSEAHLQAIGGLTTLTQLSLPRAGVDDGSLENLHGLKNLRTLVLDSNPISDHGLRALLGFPNLASVSLIETEVTTEGLAELRGLAPKLRVMPIKAISAITRYAGAGDLDGVRRVLDRNPQAVGQRAMAEWGNFPLHSAVTSGNANVVKLLLDQGADVDALNYNGETPLARAVQPYQPNFTIVRLLLDRGADPNGKGVLRAALNLANTSKENVIRLLLAAGADPIRSLGQEPGVAIPDFVSEFIALRQKPIRLADRSSAICDRPAYRLEPANLANWRIADVGRIVGPLQWSKTPSGRDFLGPLGQQAAHFELRELAKHRNVHVEMDLFIIGSWDGNGVLGAGPDLIDIRAEGVGTLLHSTFFSCTEYDSAQIPLQSFPDAYPFGFHPGYFGAAESHSLGFRETHSRAPYKRDAVYRVSYTFAHDDPDLELVITGQTVPQDYVKALEDDERWGIGSLSITTD